MVNKDLNAKHVLEIVQSIGTLMAPGTVVIGRDGRISSPVFLEAAASGLMAAGCNVTDIGMVSTPALQFITKAYRAAGGIMVTASHNPPQYNGLKVIDSDGVEVSREKEIQVEAIYMNRSWRLANWKKLGVRTRATDDIDSYRMSIMKHVNEDEVRAAKLKVVVDSGNSVGSLVTPRLLSDLGCKVVQVNGEIDGSFPGRPPEPALENLKELQGSVTANGADFGVAHDGDADRAIFVDETGEAHWGDRSFCLIEEFYLRAHPGEIVVTPVSSSQAVQEIALRHEGRVEWTPVGSIQVSRRMLEVGANLGGEENGGIFYGPHLAVRDGAMAAALISEILAKTGQRLSELFASLPQYAIAKGKVACPNNLKGKVLEKAAKEAEGERVETIDGLKIWFKDGSWALIRPSGTEAIYRIFAESRQKGNAVILVEKFSSIIRKLVSELE